MAKKALVTGVTGQDGAYLSKLLLDKGYEVYGTFRRVSTPNFWRLNYLEIFDKIKLIPFDLADITSINEAVTIAEPDEIYNLAAQSFVGAAFEQPITTGVVDGLGVTSFLEAIRHINPKIKFYQASTSEMYGATGYATKKPLNETSIFEPASPYGAAKLYGYWINRIYREGYKMFTCNGILFNHECISENTPIIVRNKTTKIISVKRIKDVKRYREKGNTVQQWSLDDTEIWDGENFVSLKFLTATKRKKENDDFSCKIVNTRHGVVEATNHHSFILSNNSKIKTRQLGIGQQLLHKEFPSPENITYMSKEEALFIGMMVGDGYISEDGVKGQFSNNSQDALKLFESLWMRLAVGTITLREFKTEYGKITQAALNGNTNYLRMIRDEIYTYDGYKKVPDRILNGSEEVKLAFLDGYNMTDGLKSNPCTYAFKNFKTDSIILAQGLLFLIRVTTKQDFNITFEEDEKYYGYYSMNLLSPVDNKAKEEKVVELMQVGKSMRAIERETGISRVFARKIHNGGHVQSHHLAKPKEEIKKIISHAQQPEWVYDIETESGRFMAGLGNIVISNSPLRGLEFVTRKISNGVAKIYVGLEDKLELGNLDAVRDWGYAPEYVEAMWKMMQEDKPDDYVIATGQRHSVLEFATEAFSLLGLKYQDHLKTDKRFLRPLDVNFLQGDASKAESKLGWKSKTKLKDLVKLMVNADVDRWQRLLNGETFPWDAPNYSSEATVLTRALRD